MVIKCYDGYTKGLDSSKMLSRKEAWKEVNRDSLLKLDEILIQ